MRFSRTFGLVSALTVIALLTACGGRNLASKPESRPNNGPTNRYDPDAEGLFGDGGFTLGKVLSGNILGGKDDEKGSGAPVNKYLWQASLDTVSFMPLASTDPFTGVIATDWSATEGAPNERFKVTVYLSSPALAATSVKVAVYRQVRDGQGTWVQTAVDPQTPKTLEEAILTRARQMRIAAIEAGEAS